MEEWGKERGMTHIAGPLGFTDFDAEGMLVEGFDQLSTMATISVSYTHLDVYKRQIILMESTHPRSGFTMLRGWILICVNPDTHNKISQSINVCFCPI